MTSHSIRSGQPVIAGLIALAMLLATALPVEGSWGTINKLSGPYRSFSEPGDLASLGGGSTVGVVYRQEEVGGWRVYFRRSLDGGATWQAPQPMTPSGTDASEASLSGFKSTFDMVWTQRDSNGDQRLWYARSKDGGVTWRAKKKLSPVGKAAAQPEIARGAGGQVAVVWVGYALGVQTQLYARVSLDGGTHFGARRGLNSVSSLTMPAVAISKYGRIHVVYDGGWYQRSGDDGGSWTSPVDLGVGAQENYWAPSIAAAGKTVIIGYRRGAPSGDRWLVVRRSLNNGGTWEHPRTISSKAANDSLMVTLSVEGGTWQASYARCTTDPCQDEAIATFVRTSASSGASWGKAQRISPAGHGRALPIGTVGTTHRLAAWLRQDNGGGTLEVYARPES